MRLWTRYRRLSLWNKLFVWGAIAGILALLYPVLDRLWFSEDLTFEVVRQAEEAGYTRGICRLDSLEHLNSLLERENETFRELRRDYAVCFAQYARSQYEMAQVQMGLGNYDSALCLFNLALMASGEDAAVMSRICFHEAGCYFFLKNETAALHCLDSSLVYQPKNPLAWEHRGVVLFYWGENSEAIESYDSALAYGGGDGRIWYNRGIALLAVHRPQEALSNFDAALVLGYDEPSVRNNRGMASLFLGKYQEALTDFDSALSLRHDWAVLWHNRALVLEQLDSIDKAVASCDSALRYTPDFQLARVLRQNLLESGSKLQ